MLVICTSIVIILVYSEENNNIIVQGPDGEPDSVPNPVKTFEDAFKHYRKSQYSAACWF